MTDSQNPLVEFLNRIRGDIFERMNQGKLNYQRDIKVLQKHVGIAKEINDLMLTGRTLNLLGIIENYMGHFDKAIPYYHEAYDQFAKIPYPPRMALMKNNIGEAHRLAGNHPLALQFFNEAREILKDDKEQIETRAIIESNTGLVMLSLEDYHAAKNFFSRVLTFTAENPWVHMQVLPESYYGIAAVYLEEKNLEKAWEYANLAIRLTQEQDHHLIMAEAYRVCAHIAEVDPNPPNPPLHYYQLSRQQLNQTNSPVIVGLMLMDEAKYQFKHQNAADGKRLAEEAKTIFTKVALADLVNRVEELMQENK